MAGRRRLAERTHWTATGYSCCRPPSFPPINGEATGDEITQPLLDANWAVRNVLPMAPPGTIRLMDAIEQAISTGAGSPGLADVLARSGVSYVLLRSDLDYGRSGATRPIVARQALARSPGLTQVASFGPEVDGDHPDDLFIDHGLSVATRALEVYRVDRTVVPVAAYDIKDVTTVVGGPEALLELSAAGQLSDAPVVLAGDLPSSAAAMGPVVLTDSTAPPRSRVWSTARQHFGHVDSDRTVHPAGPRSRLPTGLGRRVDGDRSLRRHRGRHGFELWSEAGLLAGSRPEYQPYAALDGNPATSWRPAPGTPNEGQWIEIEFPTPQRVSLLTVTFDVTAEAVPTRLTITVASEETKSRDSAPFTSSR